MKKLQYNGDSKILIRIVERINYLLDNSGGSTVSYQQTLQSGTETGEITINGTTTKMYAPTQPTKVSDLSNDSGFITNTVNNLTNYYLKSETYTQAEVNALISAIVTLNILVVQTLPTQDISTTTIYLVPKQTPETQDIYDEYIYVNNSWEHIGTTQIDLSNYYTKTQVDTLLADKVDKVTGKGLSTEDYTTAEKTKLSGISDSADAVSWTQVVGSGTKIAEITINGTSVDVYAPNGGSTYTEGDGIDISAQNEISVDTDFSEASTRTNIASGDTFATILGKIKKFFTDLKTVAFSGSYNDLSDKPTIPDISTKVSKSGDTMTGNLSLKGTNSALELNLLIEASGGMAIGGNTLKAQEDSAGTIYTNTLPSKNGKLAVVGDIPDVSDIYNNHTDKYTRHLTSSDNLNDLFTVGTYNSSGGQQPQNSPNSLNAIIKVEYQVTDNTYIQTFECYASGVCYTYKRRKWGSNAWGQWNLYYNDNNPPSWSSISGKPSIPTTPSGVGINNVIYNNNDVPEGAANLSAAANAHKITTYRNGLLIPYQMDDTNDGGMLRVRGTSESNCILELGTWDDSGSGETIQFNYYPTTSQVTPTYSVSVPKKSGTIALTSDIPTNTNQLTNGAGFITSSGSCAFASSCSQASWLGAKNSTDKNNTNGNGWYSVGEANTKPSSYTHSPLAINWYWGVDMRTSGDNFYQNGYLNIHTGNIGSYKSGSSGWADGAEYVSNVHPIKYNDNGNMLNKMYITAYSGVYIYDNAGLGVRNSADTAGAPCYASSYPGPGSSRRFKENIEALTEEEARKILEIETVTFDYKADVGICTEEERYDKRGVIAEQVEPIIPSVVVYREEDGENLIYGVDYSKFVPYLIKMVQMQQEEIDNLKAEISALKK